MNTRSRLCFAALKTILALAACLPPFASLSLAAKSEPAWRFHLGPGAAPSGWTKVSADAGYDAGAGFGFEATDGLRQVDHGAGFTTADRPFYFSAALPEGNYRVAVTLGDPDGESDTTVKAELRRLMLSNVTTARGEIVRREFVVNLRRPAILGVPDGGRNSVALKPREQKEEWWAWDEKLTLEFNGARPCVSAIEITPDDRVPTVFLLGDSTVCDQPREPFASWGQMLTIFFEPSLALANHGESGESYHGALAAGRLAKVLSAARPGDTVLMQYGHNDMKVVDVPTYKANIKKFAEAFREKKVAVVLVTPPHRRTFDKDGRITNSHKGYPDAVREVAREEKLPLIDLLEMTRAFYEAMGPEASRAAFKPGDGTHHNAYGAYELAKCIVEGIRAARLPVAKSIIDGLPRFDPAHPDAPGSVKIPPSATSPGDTPDGS
ncbi:MAG: rhamnogalacturonan acetylesterase [Opitutaceae bacterium]|jgi:lysophospholipase L1-like esterase|nr:rhamnogalacturonan acetylesterase [Opitutaceae bacterium]